MMRSSTLAAIASTSGVRMKTPNGLLCSGTLQGPSPACVRCTSQPRPVMMMYLSSPPVLANPRRSQNGTAPSRLLLGIMAKAPTVWGMSMAYSDLGDIFHPFLRLVNDQVRMILRASPSGSFTMLHSLSQIIVLFVSGSVGDHFKPGMLGFPVAANAAQDAAIFLASACASGVFPVPCSHLLVLSKQN